MSRNKTPLLIALEGRKETQFRMRAVNLYAETGDRHELSKEFNLTEKTVTDPHSPENWVSTPTRNRSILYDVERFASVDVYGIEFVNEWLGKSTKPLKSGESAHMKAVDAYDYLKAYSVLFTEISTLAILRANAKLYKHDPFPTMAHLSHPIPNGQFVNQIVAELRLLWTEHRWSFLGSEDPNLIACMFALWAGSDLSTPRMRRLQFRRIYAEGMHHSDLLMFMNAASATMGYAIHYLVCQQAAGFLIKIIMQEDGKWALKQTYTYLETIKAVFFAFKSSLESILSELPKGKELSAREMARIVDRKADYERGIIEQERKQMLVGEVVSSQLTASQRLSFSQGGSASIRPTPP